MKKLLTILFLLICCSGYSTNYYFSSSGNDGNSGTIGSPWKTLNKLNSFFNSLVSGDHVLFNRGNVFYGTIRPTKGFTSGNPVVFGAYGSGSNPVITGFTTVSSWTNLGSNIWESTSAVSTMADMNIVVINGVNTAMGRTPNTGWYNIDSHVSNTSITSSSLNSAITNWTGADMFMKTNNFAVSRNLITSASGSRINYSATTGDNGVNNNGFIIENDARTLDVQNEWYYNPSTKKVRIYSTSSPANLQVSTLDTLVYMAGKSNLTFDGIDFTGSNKRAFYISSCSNITIQNCNFNYHGLYVIWGGSNGGSNSTGFNFNHNTVNHANSHGIVFQSEFVNPYIGYNTFKNIGVLPGMVKLILGKNNGAYDAIFSANVSGLNAEYNTIDSVGYAGIHFTMGSNNRVHNNEVSNACLLAMDGAGIYMYSGSAHSGNKIYNNIVHDTHADNTGTNDPTEFLGHGIYLDAGLGGLNGYTSYVEVYGNTCFNNILSGIFLNGNAHCNFHHNTLYNNGFTQMQCTNYNPSSSTANNDTLKNNIFFSRLSGQDATYFKTIWNSPIDFFTNAGACDSNYIARPIDDNLTVHVFRSNLGQSTNRTLAQWVTYSGYDAHSQKSPVSITDVNDLRFEYNATSSTVTISLPYNYMDVRGITYNGTITLAPSSSAVLIKTGVISGNIPPVANAGSDQIITLPTNSTSLSGTGTDADGTIASYQWSKISGPGATTITTPTSQNPVVSNLEQGVYIFSLTVTDDAGAENADEVQVTVEPDSTTSVTYNVNISNPTLYRGFWWDRLTWMTASEGNVSYYIITKTTTGHIWTVKPKGDSKYTFYSSSKNRAGSAYTIRPVFIDSSMGAVRNFQ